MYKEISIERPLNLVISSGERKNGVASASAYACIETYCPVVIDEGAPEVSAKEQCELLRWLYVDNRAWLLTGIGFGAAGVRVTRRSDDAIRLWPYQDDLRPVELAARAALASELVARGDSWPKAEADAEEALIRFQYKIGTKDEPDHFHGCPQCPESKGPDCFLNVGRSHWAICEEHTTRWCVGANLFSSWRHETEEQWRENHQRLLNYRDVEGPEPPLRAKSVTVSQPKEVTGSDDLPL